MKYDVIVCGGGVVGLWTANHLAEQKKNVLLLEQFPFPHNRGSSHGPSRITRYSYSTPHHAKMMPDAFKMWDELAESQKIDLFVECGLLSIQNKHDTTRLMTSLDDVNREYERLSGREIKERFPGVADLDLLGVYEKTGGILKADKCVEALQRNLIDLGGIMLDERKVELINPINNELVEVVTNNGTYSANTVILTCGSWINKVLKPLNLQIPVKAFRVSVEYWPAVDPTLYDIRNFPAVRFHHDQADIHFYSTPIYEHPNLMKVCICKSVEVDPDVPDQYNMNEAENHQKRLKEIISLCFPHLIPDSTYRQTCLLTKTPDEDFILDFHPQYKNVIIGAGMSGHGFKISPVVGKILSDLATGEKCEHDLKYFSLSRFNVQSPL